MGLAKKAKLLMFKAVILYAIISPIGGEPEKIYFNATSFPSHVECTGFYYTYESNIKTGLLEHATKRYNSDAAEIHEIGCLQKTLDHLYEETLSNERPLFKK